MISRRLLSYNIHAAYVATAVRLTLSPLSSGPISSKPTNPPSKRRRSESPSFPPTRQPQQQRPTASATPPKQHRPNNHHPRNPQHPIRPPLQVSSRSPASDSPSTFSNALPTSADDVKAQLASAQAKIAQLTAKVSEQGEIRRRKGAEALEERGFTSAAQVVANPQQVGVPLKWVAILVLIFFFLGWKVFK